MKSLASVCFSKTSWERKSKGTKLNPNTILKTMIRCKCSSTTFIHFIWYEFFNSFSSSSFTYIKCKWYFILSCLIEGISILGLKVFQYLSLLDNCWEQPFEKFIVVHYKEVYYTKIHGTQIHIFWKKKFVLVEL